MSGVQKRKLKTKRRIEQTAETWFICEQSEDWDIAIISSAETVPTEIDRASRFSFAN